MTTPSGMAAARVRLGWAITLTVVPALEFAGSYSGGPAAAALAGAAVVPFLVAAAGRAARIGATGGALVAVVLAALGAWLAARGGGGTFNDAVPRLLTSPRPAPSSAALLAPTALAVALVAALVAACVLGGGQAAGRVRGSLAPVAGSVLLYTGAQLLAGGTADRYGIVAASVVVIAALGWAVPERSALVRTVLAGWSFGTVLPVLVVAGVALGVGVFGPGVRFDPRDHVTPPTVRLTEQSPLTQLAQWTAAPDDPILQVQMSGTLRLHLATLSDYTGITWEVDDRYAAAGASGPLDLPVAERRVPVTAVVRVERLGGIWLPAPGRPSGVSVPGALTDRDDGTVALPAHAHPGLEYTVRADVDAPTPADLTSASIPGSVPSRYLALPAAPAAFAQYARQVVRGAGTPLEQAVALEHAVSTGRTLSPTAPTGSSYGRLQQFLFGTRGSAGAQRGTAEQFAASFAVLAREVGLPSRLVVGFVLPHPAGRSAVTVHGSDATAWPELYLGTAGWVPFAPTPGETGSSDAGLRESVLQRVSKQASTLPPATAVPPPAGGAVAVRRTASSSTGLGWGAITGIVVGALVVVLLLAALAVLAARRVRSTRHRRAGARGAWAELTDLALLLGRRPGVGDTAPAVAAGFDAAYPGPGASAVLLATAAEREAFGPSGASAIGSPWRDLSVLRRRARAATPVRRRLLLPIDPRCLRRSTDRPAHRSYESSSGRTSR